LRPEALRISDPRQAVPDGQWALEGTISRSEYLGNLIKYQIKLSDEVMIQVTNYNIDPSDIRKVGARVTLVYPILRLLVFQEESGR